MTRNGIEYNLYESPYHHTVESGITFIFTSELHRKKFAEQVNENREKCSKMVSKKFGIHCNINLLSDIMLYQKIEKRGFLLRNSHSAFITADDLKIGGVQIVKTKK